MYLEESFTRDDTAALFREELGAFRKQAIYDDGRLLLDATLRGRGIACVPRLLADEHLSLDRLHILPDYPRVAGTTWWLSRVTGDTRSPMVKAMFDWILTCAT
ncbi:LysR substrate-binding domain-containing protein [Chitinimonas naiadis]